MKHAILIALSIVSVVPVMAATNAQTPQPFQVQAPSGLDSAVAIIDDGGTAYLKNYTSHPLQVTLETNGVVVAVVAIGSGATVCLGPTRDLKMRVAAVDGIPVNTEP